MKKKMPILILAGTCLAANLCLTACHQQNAVFVGTVVEVSENSLLIEPLEGEGETRSSDRITLGMSKMEDLELTEGDVVEITYNGIILESYPAQLDEVYSVELVEE